MTQNKIIFWNARSASAPTKIAFISQLLSRKPLILTISESWSKPNSENLLSFPNYVTTYHHHDSGASGLVTLIHQEASFRVLPNLSLAFSSLISSTRTNPIPIITHSGTFHSSMISSFEISLPHSPHKIGFSSIYRHPSCNTADWELMITRLSEMSNKFKHYILGGDINLNINHTPTYNNLLTTLVEPLNLTVANDTFNEFSNIKPTHILGSTLDLALSSLPNLIQSFKILSKTKGNTSDHFPIQLIISSPPSPSSPLTLPTPPSPLPQPTRIFNTHKFDAEAKKRYQDLMEPEALRFIGKLDSLTSNPCTKANIDNLWNSLYSLICEVAYKTMPTRPKNNQARDRYRWINSPVIRSLSIAFHKARRKYYRDKKRSQTNREEYLSTRHAFNKEVNRAHSEAEATVILKLMQKNPKTAIYTYTKRLRQNPQVPLSSVTDANNNLPANFKQSLNNLAQALANISSPSNDIYHEETESLVKTYLKNIECPNENDPEVSIPLEEFTAMLNKIKTTGAWGPDELPPQLFLYAPPSLIKALHYTLLYSLTHGVLPVAWTSADVTPIYKGKGPIQQATSFRPISVTSSFIRICEKIIATRIKDIIEPLLMNSQFGFRENRSTIDAIYKLLFYCREELHFTPDDFPVVFLDIEKAYDKVWWDGLLYKLHRIGIKGKLWRWLKNFICTRRFRVKQSNYLSDWFTTTAGLPQGTVLSVFLFLIFINDINDTPTLNLSSSLLNYSYKQWAIPVQLPPPSSPLLTTHNNLFADDIALWPNPHLCKSLVKQISDQIISLPGPLPADELKCILQSIYQLVLQDKLNCYALWATKWKVKFNLGDNKSELLIFSRHRIEHLKLNISLYINNIKLKQVNEYTYLGLLLSADGRWAKQEAKTINKAKSISLLLCKLAKRINYNIPQAIQIIQNLYFATVGYAIALWYPSKSFHKTSNNLLASTIKALFQLPPDTNSTSILIEARLPSTEFFRLFTTINTASRLIENNLSSSYLDSELPTDFKRNNWDPSARDSTLLSTVQNIASSNTQRLHTEPHTTNLARSVLRLGLTSLDRIKNNSKAARSFTLHAWLLDTFFNQPINNYPRYNTRSSSLSAPSPSPFSYLVPDSDDEDDCTSPLPSLSPLYENFPPSEVTHHLPLFFSHSERNTCNTRMALRSNRLWAHWRPDQTNPYTNPNPSPYRTAKRSRSTYPKNTATNSPNKRSKSLLSINPKPPPIHSLVPTCLLCHTMETRDHLLLLCPRFQSTRIHTADLAAYLSTPFSLQFILAPELIPSIKNNPPALLSCYTSSDLLLKDIRKYVKSRTTYPGPIVWDTH